jgi:hypothetical protein
VTDYTKGKLRGEQREKGQRRNGDRKRKRMKTLNKGVQRKQRQHMDFSVHKYLEKNFESVNLEDLKMDDRIRQDGL